MKKKVNTMTGRVTSATVRGMQGVSMSDKKYYAKLIEQGYTVEFTPYGILIDPPSDRVKKTTDALKSFVKAVKESR